MIDPGMQIRASYFSVLNGNITIEGSPIPIVDEKLDVNISEHDIYILMLDQIEDNETRAVKDKWVNEINFRMQICNQRKSTNTKEVVEDVSNQILTILFPTKQTTAIRLDDPLRLTYARKTSADYQPVVQNNNGFLISKILTFKNRITQQ